MVDALKDAGYNILAIPRESFVPLQLMRSDGRRTLRSVGTIADELTSDRPLPTVRTDERAADFSVTKSRRLGGSLGIEVLGRLLQAVGGAMSLAMELSREDGASISLTGVTRDSIVE